MSGKRRREEEAGERIRDREKRKEKERDMKWPDNEERLSRLSRLSGHENPFPQGSSQESPQTLHNLMLPVNFMVPHEATETSLFSSLD